MTPNKIESAAIALHDHLWYFMGYGPEWPLHLSGDDEQVEKAIHLLNELQNAIKASPYEHINYQHIDRS